MGAWWSRPAEDMVLDLLDHTRAQYNVDDNRIFLAGLSNGAIGVYTIGMFYPDRFAGLIPIAGSITPRFMNFLINLRNTPIYMIQGAHDPIFPIQLSRRVNKILSDIVEYELFFNTDTVDFDKTVTITTQKIQNQNNKLVAGEKKISYQNKIKKDLSVLLYGYKRFRDPHRLYDARVNILLETTLVQSLP